MPHYKVYKLRHQADGVLHGKTYATSAAASADVERAREKLDRAHGTHHTKTGERLFLSVVEDIVESDVTIPGYEEVKAPSAKMADLMTLEDHEGNPFHIDPARLSDQLAEQSERLSSGAARGAGKEALAKTKFEGAGTVTNPRG